MGNDSNDDNRDSNSSSNLPLPQGWSRGFSQSQQRTFYFHAATKHTQWHFPTATEAKDPSVAKQRAQAFNEREQQKKASSSKRDDGGIGGSEHNSSSSSTHATSTANLKKPPPASSSLLHSASARKKAKVAADEFLDATSVAIIVPYRDLHPAQHRAAHLAKFVPHMVKFLTKLKNLGSVSDFHVYVVEQSADSRKFNRGKLLNIGFDLARHKFSGRKHDVFIFHDVDLLPQDDLGQWYAKFPANPIHIARVWDRYSNNPKYVCCVCANGDE
jgi:N-terminal region of glycosyl transferase group 7/WW domain